MAATNLTVGYAVPILTAFADANGVAIVPTDLTYASSAPAVVTVGQYTNAAGVAGWYAVAAGPSTGPATISATTATYQVTVSADLNVVGDSPVAGNSSLSFGTPVLLSGLTPVASS